MLDNKEGVDHSSHFFPPLLAAAADYAITKGTINNSPFPTDLHVKFWGLQCLSLTRVNLSLLSFQDLGRLKQLQTLTLTDIGSHLHALQQLLAEHYKWNIATTRKQRNRGLPGMALKASLVAAMPHSTETPAALFNLVSGHTSHQGRSLPPALQQVNSTAANQAVNPLSDVLPPPPDGSACTDRPLASRTDQQGSQLAPFAFLQGLTELTLAEFPLVRLPIQDMQQLSLLTNLRSLTLKRIWGVSVPYQALTALSGLTALDVDTSQNQKCLFILPACVTGLQRLSVECTSPSISFFLPVSSQYTALTALTMLNLTEVENVTSEALASLTAFCQVEHLSIRGRKDTPDSGSQHWADLHDWKHITALRALKHLDLDHIDHTVGICTNLGKLTQLTHLQLASMHYVSRQDMQQDFLALHVLPHLHLLHCSFACYSVRSDYSSDLKLKFLQQHSGCIPDFKLGLIVNEFDYSDYEVMSDDVDSETGMEREQELQQEQAFQEWYEETYCAYERRQHDKDRDLMQMVYEEYYR